MAEKTITIRYQEEDEQDYIDMAQEFYPIPIEMIDEVETPTHTPGQWAKKLPMMLANRDLARWRTKKAQNDARVPVGNEFF